MTETVAHNKNQAILATLRSVWHLIAVLAVTVWGFFAWDFPFPAIFMGAGVLVVALVLWALFLSPKPVLRADRFAGSMIELLLLASAVAAMIELGVPWFIAAVYGVAGAVTGFFAGLPEAKQA